MKCLILLFMIFCHIVDDYYLQGWLASAKQKEWWQKNAPQELYKYDYIMALFIHSFSWSFMILLPLVVSTILSNGQWHSELYYMFFICNMTIHGIVDDMKANQKWINLIQDQMIHLVQIIITWLLWVGL